MKESDRSCTIVTGRRRLKPLSIGLLWQILRLKDVMHSLSLALAHLLVVMTLLSASIIIRVNRGSRRLFEDRRRNVYTAVILECSQTLTTKRHIWLEAHPDEMVYYTDTNLAD